MREEPSRGRRVKKEKKKRAFLPYRFGEWWKMARMTHVRSDVYRVELTLFYLGYRGACGYPTQLSACPS